MERKNDTHNDEMKNLKLSKQELRTKVNHYHHFLATDQNIDERRKKLQWIPVAQQELALAGKRGI